MQGVRMDDNGEFLRVLLSIESEGCVIHRLAARHPWVEFRVAERHVLPGGGMLAGMVVRSGEAVREFLGELAACDEVRFLQPVYIAGGYLRLRLEFKCDSCVVCRIAEMLRIPPEEISCSNGRVAAAFILKNGEELRTMVAHLREMRANFRVLEVRRGCFSPREVQLTDRQLEILRYAYRAGYFDRDRRVNLQHIARHFGLSPATIGVHMRSAIKKILKRVI